MSNTDDLKTRLVPAVCTQCGANLEVDPNQEAAVCKYCNTPFIVEKAIQNYNIQHATIEHADNVTINTKSTAESFFGFLGAQLSESRAVRREERKEQRAEEREMQRRFFKLFGIMFIVMMVFALILFTVQTIRGDSGEETENTGSVEHEMAAFVLPQEEGRFPAEDAEGEYRISYSGSLEL